MTKNDLREKLMLMRNTENEEKVDYLLKVLGKISDDDLDKKLSEKNLSEDNIDKFLNLLIKNTVVPENSSKQFIGVNDWFCYGRTGDTIHLHIIPPDLRGTKEELGDEAFYNLFKELLEDFLSRMQGVFEEDTTVNTLFAVSPIFYNQNISWAFDSLGFDKIIEVDPNNKEDNMTDEQKEHFINMFNKGEKKKKVFYTQMPRERLLETEYHQIPDVNNKVISKNK